jgi:DNA-binding winged helix-turn-helix (wHTH) protein/tetratricopeptide (TPR) repeat protein
MTYRFDDFTLNPATRELRRNGVPVVLPARAFDCLAYLIEHRERAVGRDELIAAVWGRVEISDALLGHTMVKVRRSLGDSGNEQRGVRTVPRFGYRWVLPVELVPVDASDDDAAVVSDAREEAPGVAPVQVADALPHVRRTLSRSGTFALAAVLLVLVGFVAWRFAQNAPLPQVAPVAAAVDAPAPAIAAALVLPALVDASDDWLWLRLGVMDLVANRLRAGAIATTPSETVVGLLRQRAAAGDDLLHDTTFAQVASMRVQPRISLAQGRWNVRLDAFGAQRALSVDADADDAIVAARAAADALLRKLGHANAFAQASPEAVAGLDELLQRSGAAMLADQLEQARALIAGASPLLQQQPQVEQRMAQIELRRGDYEAVQSRLHALLDSPALARDDALRARAMMTLAAAFVRTQQSERAMELYDEAIALRGRAGDHEVIGVARLGRGSLLAQQGRHDEATAELARARIELATVGDSLGVASVDINLGEFQRMRHRPADALVLLKKAVREFELLGAREGRAYALAQQAGAERELLDAEAALSTSERFWPDEAHTSNERMRWSLTIERAECLVAFGRVAEGEALLARVAADADPRRDALARAQASLLAATIEQRRGALARALADLPGALVPVLREGDPRGWTHALVLQARLQRDEGRVADAATTTASLQAWADASGDDSRKLHAQLAAAGQACVEGRREPALEAFARAMAIAERLGVPEELVEVGAPYLAALVEASQLDTARAVSGRIAVWAEHDPRAATAQAHLFRALGQDDAARSAEEGAAHLLAAYAVTDGAGH